ncbi:hypothetical protein GGR52DRAFT_142966 [Hypoxylon sp. FL1284]|nr:hypothetical protein GGR52DRAFT_142966 [Hypoxylon sp. FL1284]
MSTNPTLTSGARMVVTAHDPNGTSVIQYDSTVEAFSPFGPTMSSFVHFDERGSVPVDNQQTAPQMQTEKIPRVAAGGVSFGVTNLAPRHSAPMHRTVSLDYGVVLAGEVVLALDGGAETTLRAGDVVVQQGVNHAWHNRTDEVCRIVFCQVGARKIRLASGEELEETVIKLPPS